METVGLKRVDWSPVLLVQGMVDSDTVDSGLVGWKWVDQADWGMGMIDWAD